MWNYLSPQKHFSNRRHHIRTSRIVSLLLGLGLLVGTLVISLPRASHAQDDYGATLIVMQGEVEIQRANTDAWISLPRDAVTPFGAGDRLRTDFRGRAYLNYADAETLILPNSTFDLLALGINADNALTLHAQLVGRTVHHIPADITWESYQFETASVTITQPAQRFGFQQNPDEPAYFVVDSGVATFDTATETSTLSGDEGVRVNLDASIDPIVSISNAPINFARVEGYLDGCDGVLKTAGDVLTRVRAGPSDEFFFMGSIASNTPVKIMGSAPGPGGLWYRIQFLSDFGWVSGELVQTQCDLDALVQYTRAGVENAPGIVLVQDVEIALLEPFFGLPRDDVWFYRRLNLE